MVKIFLVTGFLGSGKTTFLNHQLKNNLYKTGVLVNEFGKTSIDTISLKTDELIELTNGSIFCSCLKDNFIESLRELILRNLDYIFIEASGLSDPSNFLEVINILKRHYQLSFEYFGTITLIDTLYFIKMSDVMVSVKQQVKKADYIIYNKCDLVSNEQLFEVIYRVTTLNKNANQYTTEFGRINAFKLQKVEVNEYVKDSSNKIDNKPYSITIKVDHLESTIDLLFKRLQGKVLRGKGYVKNTNTIKYDLVLDKLDKVICEDVTKCNELVFLFKRDNTLLVEINSIIKEVLIDNYEVVL